MKRLIYDLETTGVLPHKHGIHQISGLIEIDGIVVESFDFKVAPNPKAEIDQEALNVCGVTVEQIRAYRPMNEVYKDLITIFSKYVDKFNKQDKFFLCGFNNAWFDDKFFNGFFKQNEDKHFNSWFWINSMDVMVLASYKLARVRHTMPNFKLSSVAKACGIEVDDSKLHDAVYDLYLTKEIERILWQK